MFIKKIKVFFSMLFSLNSESLSSSAEFGSLPPNMTPLYSSPFSQDTFPPPEPVPAAPNFGPDPQAAPSSSAAPSSTTAETSAAPSSETKDPTPLYFHPELSKKLTAWFESLYQHRETAGDRLLSKVRSIHTMGFNDPNTADEYLFRIVQECMLYLPSGGINPLIILLPSDIELRDVNIPDLVDHATEALAEMTSEELLQLQSEFTRLQEQVTHIQLSDEPAETKGMGKNKVNDSGERDGRDFDDHDDVQSVLLTRNDRQKIGRRSQQNRLGYFFPFPKDENAGTVQKQLAVISEQLHFTILEGQARLSPEVSPADSPVESTDSSPDPEAWPPEPTS